MLNTTTFVHKEKQEADNKEIYRLQSRAPQVMTNLTFKKYT